ncbi:MAG: ATP-binding protein, partial [Kiloniellales bacterium]
AAAIELGDNLTVPVHRSLPGPVVQALAYESLVQGRAIHGTGAPLALLIGAILAFVLGPYLGASSWRRGALVTGATVLGIETAALAVLAAAPINLTTAPWLTVVVMGFAHGVLRLVSLQDLQLFRQRMALTYRRALMDRVVEDSFDGIVTTDHRGNIAVFNRKAAEILGCRAREVAGRSLRETFPVAADFVDQMAIEPVTTGVAAAASHSGPHECEIERPNGERIAIELVISRFLARRSRNRRERRTRQRQIHTVTFRDIAERKQARDAERAASEQAQAANRAKSEFLANMSHELRTPLNAILGFSEMIRSEVLGPITPPQYAAYIGDIHDSGQHLLEIINDILDVSRIELGQIQLNEEVVDLKATADACCRILSGWPASAERDFEAQVMPDMPGLFADARLIKQTLVNLLSNAVKYSDPGDRVALRIFVDTNGVPTIEVEDSGIGIEPSMIPALTEPFYQVDGSLGRTREGNGLGLCLVSAFTELHGGSLEIESELKVGTKVSVRFPPTRVVALADKTDPAGRQANTA